MHKIIILFVTAILVFSVSIDSFAGKKATSISKQKVEKQAAQKKALKYSKIPFALSGDTIPKDYSGHSLRSIHKALEARLKNNQKREFETTTEFNERVERENKLPLIGNLTMADNFALVVKPSSAYDADNKTLEIILHLEHPRQDKFKLGILGDQERESYESKYVGRNAYGTKATVTEVFTSYPILAVNNHKKYLYENYIELGTSLHFTLKNVSVDNAKKLKNNLSAICVFKLDSPFIGKDGYTSDATIDTPIALVNYYLLVYGNLSSIIFFNNKTGEIVHSSVNE